MGINHQSTLINNYLFNQPLPTSIRHTSSTWRTSSTSPLSTEASSRTAPQTSALALASLLRARSTPMRLESRVVLHPALEAPTPPLALQDPAAVPRASSLTARSTPSRQERRVDRRLKCSSFIPEINL